VGDPPATLFDVGAQAERTAMAWQRTGISVMISGALVVRWSVAEDFTVWPGIALTLFGAFLSLYIVRQRYRRVLHTVRAGQTPLSRYLVPGTTVFLLTLVVAVAVAVAEEYAHL
jgi:uncharacterized membrane protein YidH (DUF202 family)